ncbi:MAG: hypothetical protein QNJ34_14565 [Xenococcaceae cyanobacterium MO_188.B29]|nr:hypothetical protein [Xenococcaceae cyanobacterium MO_188.B29]
MSLEFSLVYRLADLHSDRESNAFKQLLLAWKSFYFNRLENISIEDKNDFDKTVNSIYFILENRIANLFKKQVLLRLLDFIILFLVRWLEYKIKIASNNNLISCEAVNIS